MNVFEANRQKLQTLITHFESLTTKLIDKDINKLVEDFLVSESFQRHCTKMMYNNPIAPKQKPNALTFINLKTYIERTKRNDFMSVTAWNAFKYDLQAYPDMFDELASYLEESCLKPQPGKVLKTCVRKKKDDALTSHKPKKVKIPSALKRLVWNKHIGEDIGKSKCVCCKVTDITQMSFHCGHVISEKNGGGITLDNLLPVCQNCNSSVATMNMDEFKNLYKI